MKIISKRDGKEVEFFTKFARRFCSSKITAKSIDETIFEKVKKSYRKLTLPKKALVCRNFRGEKSFSSTRTVKFIHF